MAAKKNGFMRAIALSAVVFVMLAALAFGMYACTQSNGLRIGGGNIKMLNELNAEWTLSTEYEIEQLYIGDMYAELLQERSVSSTKVILQLHGGAYIRSLNYRENLYQRMAEQYARLSGAAVLTIDYRTAPENPFPAALEDAIKAYSYLQSIGYAGSDIIVAGDSAGGGLTLALALYLRDSGQEMPSKIITMSAWTNLNYRKKLAYVGNNAADNPYISPIYGQYHGFPPMLMQVGTRDIQNDTEEVSALAAAAGADVTQTTYSGMPHVFQALFPRLEQANLAWDEVGSFLAA